ncbi:Crp/Fnr family transcriptional regulator [Maricurvus nonylphenolicus]|uniref:Crp/Fnr family transcriptional regulator n=1 Tax=Maricurvus nonylphenolicus TaxID=1008307 RepID=UPI0036F1A844
MAQTIREQLDESGLFRDFPDNIKQQLADMSRTQTFRDGEMIYQQGDESAAMFGVLEGAIKLIGEDPNGKFFFFGLVTPGQWFGETSAIDGAPRGQSAMVIGNTKVMVLRRADFVGLLDRQPELYRYFMPVFCRRLRLAGQVMEESAFLPVSVRLASNMLRMHRARQQYGIKLSQEDLAACLGVTRQSIFRVLKEWEKNGWVTIEYGDVQIAQPQKLQELIEE